MSITTRWHLFWPDRPSLKVAMHILVKVGCFYFSELISITTKARYILRLLIESTRNGLQNRVLFFPKMLRGWDMRSDMSPCLHFNFVLWQGERRRSLRRNYSVYQNSETRFWRAIPAWYLGQKSADSDRPLLRSIQPKLVFHHQNTAEIWRFLSAN